MIALRGLDARLRPYAEYAHAIAAYYGITPRVASVRRTWSEQERLHARYVAARAAGRFPSPAVPYPANAPGDSAHQFGLAWDSQVTPQYRQWWKDVRRWVGFTVYDHDAPHAELPGWRAVVQ
jgi:hypothetical protein